MLLSIISFSWNAHSDPEFYRPSDVRPGHFFAVNRTHDLAETVGRFYEVFDERKRRRQTGFYQPPPPKTPVGGSTGSGQQGSQKQLHFSLPHQDLEGKGLVMSISQPFYDGETFLGVMGVDLHVADLFDQIVHFGGSPPSPTSGVVFIVHAGTGLSVYHPAALNDLLTSTQPPSSPSPFPRQPSTHDIDGESIFEPPEAAPPIAEPILHADVSQFERVPGFETLVKPKLLKGENNGTVELYVEIVSLKTP